MFATRSLGAPTVTPIQTCRSLQPHNATITSGTRGADLATTPATPTSEQSLVSTPRFCHIVCLAYPGFTYCGSQESCSYHEDEACPVGLPTCATCDAIDDDTELCPICGGDC